MHTLKRCAQGKPEIDSGSREMRETWMLLEYADRGNLDRALVQGKFMTPDGRLDLVLLLPCPTRLFWPPGSQQREHGLASIGPVAACFPTI